VTARVFFLNLIFVLVILGPGLSIPISISFFFCFFILCTNLRYLPYLSSYEIMFILAQLMFFVINGLNSYFLFGIIATIFLITETKRISNDDKICQPNFLVIFFSGFCLNAQLVFHSIYTSTARTGLGADVNYDSFVIFIWAIVALEYKIKSQKIKYLMIILVVFTIFHTAQATQSKMFVLMVILYFLSIVSVRYKLILTNNVFVGLLKKYNFYLIWTCLAFVILISVFVVGLGIVYEDNSGDLVDRLQNFNDGGIYGRATANLFWIQELINNRVNLFGGIDVLVMQEAYPLIPHNSYIFGMLYGGIIHLFIMIIFISSILRRLENYQFIKIFPPFIVLTNALHGIFSPIFLVYIYFWFYAVKK
jgi:hypothetical protein